MSTEFDIKKPELATADGQKYMGVAKIREGVAKKWTAKKEVKAKKGVYESSRGGGILSSGGRHFASFRHWVKIRVGVTMVTVRS